MTFREVVKILEENGWRLERQVGSHRQYRHPSKPGTVTIAGDLGKDVKRGTLSSIWRQAGLKEPRR
ncbi:MAG: type II toxin-antitoxin system HicA family toxin [Actinomycetota bacterium]